MKNKEIKNWMFKFSGKRHQDNARNVIKFFLTARPGKTLDTCNMDFSINGTIIEGGSSNKPITLHPVKKLVMEYGRKITVIKDDGKKFSIRRQNCRSEMNELIKDTLSSI